MRDYELIGTIDTNCEICNDMQVCNNFKDKNDNYYLYCDKCTKEQGLNKGRRVL